jgi:hypothetical protein
LNKENSNKVFSRALSKVVFRVSNFGKLAHIVYHKTFLQHRGSHT